MVESANQDIRQMTAFRSFSLEEKMKEEVRPPTLEGLPLREMSQGSRVWL